MITSTSNKQIKHIIQLQKKARLRKEEDVFVVEGPRMLAETPKELRVALYVAESYADSWQEPGAEIVADHVMKAMADTATLIVTQSGSEKAEA